MADVNVVWTGLECQIRQEVEDDIVGSVQVIPGTTPQPPLKFPESGELKFGPPGLRIFSAQRLLYSGPAKDLSVSLALVQVDAGDAEQEKQAVANAISTAATAAVAKFTGGAGVVLKPFIQLLSEALVEGVSDLLGLADNPFNPAAIFIPKDRMLDANSRRRIRQRPDDPRVLQFTDEIVCTGTDDDGDLGKYVMYLDVQPSGTPGGGGGMPPVDDGIGTPTLRRGSQGAAVEKLQRLLNAHVPDLRPLGVDGDFGSVTDERVRVYQRRVEIEVDGVAGPQTWGMLTGGELAEEQAAGTPTVSSGARGPAVRRLQRLLNARVPNVPALAIDGVFGPVTEAHVRKFQTRLAIIVDGIVGPQTWGALAL
ncbi:peptidoglycan-binding protein [Streptomyces sp. NPDC058659]|uniref:peptidoglycan-binding domain-containing protein n=1 Tax=unclassified Streptomyces TaxID=2593676 RepID=UPI00365FE7BB